VIVGDMRTSAAPPGQESPQPPGEYNAGEQGHVDERGPRAADGCALAVDKLERDLIEQGRDAVPVECAGGVRVSRGDAGPEGRSAGL
jgi:hypothetical protein